MGYSNKIVLEKRGPGESPKMKLGKASKSQFTLNVIFGVSVVIIGILVVVLA